MIEYFVEFKKLPKINANPILLNYDEWEDFSKNIERDELVILGQYVELYHCTVTGLSAMITIDNIVLFYDDLETLLIHIKVHLNLPDNITIFDIKSSL